MSSVKLRCAAGAGKAKGLLGKSLSQCNELYGTTLDSVWKSAAEVVRNIFGAQFRNVTKKYTFIPVSMASYK